MDWTKGFSAEYYAAVVDAETWRDVSRIEITSGSVKLSDSGLRGSADIGCVRYDQGQERWVRIWLNARQNNDADHVALFTGLACAPGRKINGQLTTNNVQLYSVLKPADDVLLPLGWYAPAGISGETLIRTLLEVTPAPVVFAEDAPAIVDNIVAESGETHSTMLDKILSAINWRLRIDGDGTINVIPKAENASGRFDALESDAVEPSIDVEYDWFSAPNVFRAVSGDESETVRDDSIDSPLSTERRGREVWKEDSSCNLNDGESLYDYARRRLKEEQQVSFIAKYTRRFDPGLMPGDIIQLNYPGQELTGNYLITSQSLALEAGCPVSEEVVKHGE